MAGGVDRGIVDGEQCDLADPLGFDQRRGSGRIMKATGLQRGWSFVKRAEASSIERL